jgi:drug/metabolite transporter (DMT)-like permease
MNPGPGVALILLVAACFGGMDTTVRFAGATLPVLAILWVRYATQAAVMFATAHPRFQALRGALLLATSCCSFFGVQYMPVPEFTAVNMITPVLVTLLAAVWLQEPVSALRWALVVGCFAGALVVLRPGSGLFGWAAAFPVAGALTYAAFQVLTRRLSGDESPTTTHFYTGLTGTLLLTPLLWAAGIDLPAVLAAAGPGGWGLLLVIAVLGTAGHLLLIVALGLAPAATLMPFLYAQIGVATVAGWLVFRQLPDAWAWLGMAVIAACGATTAALNLRDQRREAAGVAPPD